MSHLLDEDVHSEISFKEFKSDQADWSAGTTWRAGTRMKEVQNYITDFVKTTQIAHPKFPFLLNLSF